MKEQLLTSFDEKFPIVDAAHKDIAFFARDLKPEIKSFLSHAIDTAYAEGRKQTLADVREGLPETPNAMNLAYKNNVLSLINRLANTKV